MAAMERERGEREGERILRVEAGCRWPRRKRTRPQLII
jgi:hypothetical protein